MVVTINAPPTSSRQGGSRSGWEVALTALVLLPVLVPAVGRARLGRFALMSLITAGTGIGVVHVLGTELPVTFLKDLLLAAELGSLGTTLSILVGVATVTAAIDAFTDTQLYIFGRGKAVTAGALATAAMAAFAPPVVILVVAGAGIIANAVYWYYVRYSSFRN
jgi:hypothetical protein